MDWNTITPELQKKLDPAHVKKPTDRFGPKGDYVEGWFVIQEANRIFGFGAWSYTITSLTKDACELVTKQDGKKQWQAAYTCIVRVTVGETIREDVGFGSGFAAQIGDAIEGATKEAVTDALKRCLRTFGNVFGLALYDKSRENVGRDEPPPPPLDAVAARDRIVKALTEARTGDDLARILDAEKLDLTRMKDEDPPKRLECDHAYKQAAARIKAAQQEKAA
jgi:DNA recombination protein Rad52